MELWIRTQNKGALIKVEMLGHTDGIIHSYLGINKTILGTYKSKERALEVLDEIQNLLDASNRVNGKTGSYEFLDLKTKANMLSCVYEMPQE